MRTFAAALVSLMLFSYSPAQPQSPETAPNPGGLHTVNNPLPVSANPPATLRMPPAQHKFFDRKNALAIACVAASLAGDGWSTQRALAMPGAYEVNPVARPFVGSRAGKVAYSGASFALVTGGIYLAHKTNYHKLERIGPLGLAGWEGFLTYWNLRQLSRASH
jgi:hypothetical protein